MNCWLEPGQARLSCKSGPVLRNSQRLCWWARAQGSGGQNGIILGQALTWSIEVVRAIPLITLITHQDKILTLSGGAICGPIKHHLQLECACYSTWRSENKHFPDQRMRIFLTKSLTAHGGKAAQSPRCRVSIWCCISASLIRETLAGACTNYDHWS